MSRLIPLLPSSSPSSFLAPRLYRIERVARWVVEHYEMDLPLLQPDPSDPSAAFPFPNINGEEKGAKVASSGQFLTVLCRHQVLSSPTFSPFSSSHSFAQVLPRHWTLAHVKAHVWKSSADLVLEYRLHPLYKEHSKGKGKNGKETDERAKE